MALFVREGVCDSQMQGSQTCESPPQAQYFVTEVTFCQNPGN